MTQRVDLPLLSYVGNVANPVNTQDVATKNYVDNKLTLIPSDDISVAVNVNGVSYVGDKTVNQQSTSFTGQFNAFTSDANAILTLSVTTLPFTTASMVRLDTALGQSVVGTYTAGSGVVFATINNLITDRTNGFLPSQSYTFVRAVALKPVVAGTYYDSGVANNKYQAFQLGAGSNITIALDPTNYQRAIISAPNSGGGGGGGGTTTAVLNFTSSTTPSAGQTFTNSAFSNYLSTDYITVTVNGSTLNRSNYSLSGQILTILAYLPSSSNVQVQPSNSGGSGGGSSTWSVGGNNLLSDSGFLGSTNSTDVNIGVANISNVVLSHTFTRDDFTVNVGASSSNYVYLEDTSSKKVYAGANIYTAPLNSNTFTLLSTVPNVTAVSDVASASATEVLSVYTVTTGTGFTLTYVSGTSTPVNSHIFPITATSGSSLTTISGIDVTAQGTTLVVFGSSSVSTDAQYIYWTSITLGVSSNITFTSSSNFRSQVSTTPVLDIYTDNTNSNLVWVLCQNGLYRVNLSSTASTLVVSGSFTGFGSLAQIGTTIFIYTATAIYSVITDVITPTLKTIITLSITNNLFFYVDSHTPSAPRVWITYTGQSTANLAVTEFVSDSITQALAPLYLGNNNPATFNTPLLAGNSSAPTFFTGGSLGQALCSSGEDTSPFWAPIFRSVETRTVNQSITAGVNTVINWTLTSPDTTLLTYTSGTFTNVSGRTLIVIVAYQILYKPATGTNIEVDFWITGNGTRYTQQVIQNAPQNTSQVTNSTTVITIPNNATFSTMCYVSPATMTIGTGVTPVPFASQNFLSLLIF